MKKVCKELSYTQYANMYYAESIEKLNIYLR